MAMAQWVARRLTNYSSGRSLGHRLRERRLKPLLDMIEDVYREKGRVRLLDIGGTTDYWRVLPRGILDRHNVEITVVNLPGADRTVQPRFHSVWADGCALPYATGAFDIAHSNSVIEHVGGWERMRFFATEISRVSRKYFVQTPNFWFPIEPHCMTPFFHWLPRPVRIWMVLRLQLGHWHRASSVDEAVRAVERITLLDRRMLSALFDDARIEVERVMLLPKSLLAIRR